MKAKRSRGSTATLHGTPASTTPAPRDARSARPVAPGAAQAPDWARAAIVAAIALFLALTLEHLLWEIAYPLALIFGAVVIAQGFAPVVNGLSRWLPRPLAVVALYLSLLALAAAGVWLFLPTLIAQGREFAADLPGVEADLRDLAERWSPIALEELAGASQGYLAQFSGLLIDLPAAVFSVGASLVLVFFLSLYWLITQPQLRGWILGLIPQERRDEIGEMLTEVGETVGGYVRGVIISALSVATLTYIGLLLLGMPSALVLAVLAGVGELIPVLGPFLAAVPAVGIALATGAASPLIVLAFYIGLQQVESNVLIPLIMRGQARIPPLLSLVAFLIGAAVGGIIGALIAIPLFGALRVLTVRLLVPAERELVGVSPAEAAVVHHEEIARDSADDV